MANILYLDGPAFEKEGTYVIQNWSKKINQYGRANSFLCFIKDEQSGNYTIKYMPFSGTLLRIFYHDGEIIPWGYPLCIIGEQNEDISGQIDLVQRKFPAAIHNSDNKETTVVTYRNYSEPLNNMKLLSIQSNDPLSQISAKVDQINKCYTAQIADIRRRMQETSISSPFVITFAGRFKTGKSSLINCILGTDLLPTKATTATTVVTRIFYGDTKRALIREKGKERTVSIPEAQKMILEYQVEDENNPAEVIFELPIPWLSKDVEIRDTPGMDDSAQDGRLEKVTMNSLLDTDLCICVYDAGSFPSAKERERTKLIHSMLNGNVVYAVNCTNHLNSLEGLKLVERSAQNLFGTFEYSIPDMGKYFLICSSPDPKMQFLDGFNSWFSSISDGKHKKTRDQIRASSGKAHLKAKVTEYEDKLKSALDIINFKLQERNQQHISILNQKASQIRSDGKNKSNAIKSTTIEACNEFLSTYGLSSELNTALNSGNDYSTESNAAVKRFFKGKYQEVWAKWPSYFVHSFSGIDSVIDSYVFPGRSSIAVAASSDEKNAWTAGGAVGGAFLTLLTGGAALPFLLAGAAVGRAIGSSDNYKDNSVSNTMTFVNENIIPGLRSEFERMARRQASKYISDSEKKAAQCTSGFESEIQGLSSECSKINSQIKSLQRI